jgi:endonuclease YncB( thermonuclease family)
MVAPWIASLADSVSLRRPPRNDGRCVGLTSFVEVRPRRTRCGILQASMGKLFLGVLLLLLWLWIGPDEFSLPSFGREGVSEERVEERVEERKQASSTLATVRYVIDGDTFDTVGGDRVRLLGIDTPERGECYYQEATDYARTLIDGREVRLEIDERNVDRYERLLRHVFVVADDTSDDSVNETEIHLNLRLVEEGLAEVLAIPPDKRYREELAAAEAAAKAASIGRWGVCE